MEILDNFGIYELGELEVKYIGNIYGNEVLGRELLLQFVKYFCENYEIDLMVRKFVMIIGIYILLSMNLDGYEMVFV